MSLNRSQFAGSDQERDPLGIAQPLREFCGRGEVAQPVARLRMILFRGLGKPVASGLRRDLIAFREVQISYCELRLGVPILRQRGQ